MQGISTEDPRYNDSLLPKFLLLNQICCYKLNMDPSKASVMDIFEVFFMTHTICVLLESSHRGDSTKYTKRMFS